MKKVRLLLALITVAISAEQLPLCGVLTIQGYHTLNFIVPQNNSTAQVKRYEVIDTIPHGYPLEVMAGWWICVTEGEILSEPTEESYGKIEIHSLKSDQTNGERGQE